MTYFHIFWTAVATFIDQQMPLNRKCITGLELRNVYISGEEVLFHFEIPRTLL